MTPDNQLTLWVEGVSKHNDERSECCPDFSCCNPNLLAPVEVRKAFVVASEEQQMKFLGAFLGAAFETLGKKAYIAGKGPPE